MNNRFYYGTLMKNILLLICLFFILTAFKCTSDKYPDPHCEVVINSPTTTIFTENDNITFTAHLEHWEYENNDENDQYLEIPALGEVRWVSDIDGIISTEDYTNQYELDHSFSTSSLTPGNHNISCYAVNNSDEMQCSDEIYIEILNGPQIEYVTFDFVLDEAETKTTYSNGSESISKRISHYLTSVCGTSVYSDNVYTTSFDKNECNSMTGFMTITFLNNPKRVDVSAEWNTILGDCVTNYVLDIDGILFDGNPGSNSDLYHESGSSVSRINISQYEIVCTPSNTPNSTKELLNTNCGDNAEISVYIYYED